MSFLEYSPLRGEENREMDVSFILAVEIKLDLSLVLPLNQAYSPDDVGRIANVNNCTMVNLDSLKKE